MVSNRASSVAAIGSPFSDRFPTRSSSTVLSVRVIAWLDQSSFLGTYPAIPPEDLTLNPNPAPTVDLTQGRGGTSPETWIDPFGLLSLSFG